MTRLLRNAITIVACGITGMSVLVAQTTPPPQQTPPDPQGRGGRVQRPGGRQNLPPPGPAMGPGEMQAYLDAYELVLAERELQVTPEQFPNFVTRLKALQNLRRQHQQARRRLLQEMQPLVFGQTIREDAVAEKLKAFDDLRQRASQETSQAYASIDEVLTPRQRVRLRLLEERLERQKVELLARIRQPGAPARDTRGAGSK